MKHSLMMIAGCVLPLVFLFLLPLFGISSGVTLFVFIVLMFGGHLFMMKGHAHQGHAGHSLAEQVQSKEVHNDNHNS